MKKLLLCYLVALTPWAYAQETQETYSEVTQVAEVSTTLTEEPVPEEVGFLESISLSFESFVQEVKEYYNETQEGGEVHVDEGVEDTESGSVPTETDDDDSVQEAELPTLEPVSMVPSKTGA